MVYKFHLWYHLAKYMKICNVRSGWVFVDEDFVGRIATIAHAASYARGDLRLAKPLIDKYILGSALDITFNGRFSS